MKIQIISLVLQYDGIGEETHKKNCRILMREASAICDHCVRALHQFSGFRCKRINLCCKNEKIDSRSRTLWSVMEKDVLFSWDYFSLPVEKKKEYLFLLVSQGLREVFEENQWDFSLVAQALDSFKEANYVSSFYTKHQCRYRSNTATLYCVQAIEHADFFVDVFQKRNLVERIKICTLLPHVMDYDRYLGQLKWESPQEIQLVSRDEKTIFTCDLTGYDFIL